MHHGIYCNLVSHPRAFLQSLRQRPLNRKRVTLRTPESIATYTCPDAGLANYRLVRCADDFVVLAAGNRSDAEALRDDVAQAQTPMGLRFAEDRTTVAHIDEGVDFLGWHIQRKQKRGTLKR